MTDWLAHHLSLSVWMLMNNPIDWSMELTFCLIQVIVTEFIFISYFLISLLFTRTMNHLCLHILPRMHSNGFFSSFFIHRIPWCLAISNCCGKKSTSIALRRWRILLGLAKVYHYQSTIFVDLSYFECYGHAICGQLWTEDGWRIWSEYIEINNVFLKF